MSVCNSLWNYYFYARFNTHCQVFAFFCKITKYFTVNLAGRTAAEFYLQPASLELNHARADGIQRSFKKPGKVHYQPLPLT